MPRTCRYLLSLAAVCAWLAACSLHRAPQPGGTQAGLDAGGGGAAIGTQGNGAGTGTLGVGASGNGALAGSGNSSGGLGDGGAWLGDAAASMLDASLDAAAQGYVPGRVGAPCTSDNDCRLDGTNRICFTESYFAPLLTLPGGYCGKLCEASQTHPCEDGAVCITFPTLPPIFACMRACTASSECRMAEGYSCNKPGTSQSMVCSLPN
ncbi:MAG TPA: hypothetical protein VHM19_06810 [Polyangiales bacterium]|nr:hypothetical protein [Polyangiales bacterium]